MVGMIWVIQVVHYPLFAEVAGDFRRYEAAHTRRMGRLLLIPAPVEIVTALALVWARPDGVSLGWVLAGGALLAALWLTTAAVQAPLHRRLSFAPTDAAIARLVASNWARTIGWTARGVVVAVMALSAG